MFTNYIKVFQLIAAVILSASVYGQKNDHSSFFPGKLWPDNDGNHINAHGGGILYHNENYYWYGEHKGANSLAEVGVRVYKSKDLINWSNEGVALEVSTDPNSEITIGSVIERPKVIFNKKTKLFVMWFHLELKGQGYAAARTAVATSQSPTGPFKYIQSFRPNQKSWPQNFELSQTQENLEEQQLELWTAEWHHALVDGLYVRRDFKKGQMSRDMTVFVDDDDTAYHISSSEENQTLHISKLTDDYLGFSKEWVRVQPGGQNEAPAVFKHKETYYMITSGLTGWKPNKARSFKAKSMFGPWEKLANPAKGKNADVTFFSQSTYVLPINRAEGIYIYMGDRWNPKKHSDGRYIWLPLVVKQGQPAMEWQDEWSLDQLKYISDNHKAD